MRRRGLPLLLVALGTAVLAVGALLRWWTVHYTHPMLGDRVATLTGREAVPALLVLAAIALAGVGAGLAARGVLRRLVGLLLAGAGIAVGIAAVSGARALPAAEVVAKDGQAAGIPVSAMAGELAVIGPVLAVAGAVGIVAGGLMLLLGAGGRGLGSRFDRTPSTGRQQDDPDAHAADLWKQLSAGEDPTG